MSADATNARRMNASPASDRRMPPSRAHWSGAPWVVIAANPFSGTGANRRHVEELVAALARLGLPAQVLWDTHHYQRLLADPRWMADCVAVVCGGGDGSLNAVINCKPLAPIAVLPIGNENLFAAHLELTVDPYRLATAIYQRKTIKLDLGRANRRLFTLMASVGFDSDVVRRVSQWRHRGNVLRRVSRASYALPIMQSLTGYRFPKITLEADGRIIRGAHVFVFNLPCYGFNLPFAPDARADDGMLDWVVLERGGRLVSLRYAWAVLRGIHRKEKDVHTGRAKRLRLTTDRRAWAQADGDLAGELPITIETVPEALEIIVPQE